MAIPFLHKHEFSTVNGEFDYIKWRLFVEETAKGVNSNLQAIIPFGFEITGNKSYLGKNLKRFYIYIGHEFSSTISSVYKSEMMNVLVHKMRNEFPLFFSTLYEIDIQSDKKKLVGQNSKIVIYERNIKGNLAHDWADYLISTPSNMLSKKLPDIVLFESNKVSRSYVFQLSIINHYLFESGKLDNEEFSTVHYLSTPYRNDSKNSIENIAYCKEVLNSIVLKQANSIDNFLSNHSNHDELLNQSVQDYHSSVLLDMQVSSVRLSQYRLKVEALYNSYGN